MLSEQEKTQLRSLWNSRADEFADRIPYREDVKHFLDPDTTAVLFTLAVFLRDLNGTITAIENLGTRVLRMAGLVAGNPKEPPLRPVELVLGKLGYNKLIGKKGLTNQELADATKLSLEETNFTLEDLKGRGAARRKGEKWVLEE